MEHHDVVIIGGGPSGLATALELSRRGIRDVVVLEREAQAGGIPRHCGHRGFAPYRNFGWMTGPALANRLRKEVERLDVRTGATVLEFTLRDHLRIHDKSGVSEMSAGKIVLATGTRESSRAARLIGGAKIRGVMNTGELQQRVYLEGNKPFEKPVIVGSEWVSYSALMTCKHKNIRPVAMLAEESAAAAPGYFAFGARLGFGVPVWRKAKLLNIVGRDRVESVEIDYGGKNRTIACDGVIVSGHFRSEIGLVCAGLS